MNSPSPSPITVVVEASPWEGLAVLVAVAAAVVAALAYRRDVRDRRIAAARLCFGRISTTTHYAAGEYITQGNMLLRTDEIDANPVEKANRAKVPITVWETEVVNGSNEPLTVHRVEIRQQGTGTVLARTTSEAIKPGSSVTLNTYAARESEDIQPMVHPVVLFEDGAGHGWSREAFQPVTRYKFPQADPLPVHLRSLGGGLWIVEGAPTRAPSIWRRLLEHIRPQS